MARASGQHDNITVSDADFAPAGSAKRDVRGT
jgi:hypothetical protein